MRIRAEWEKKTHFSLFLDFPSSLEKKSPNRCWVLQFPREGIGTTRESSLIFFLPFSLCRGKSVRREKSHSFNITSCSRPPFLAVIHLL